MADALRDPTPAGVALWLDDLSWRVSIEVDPRISHDGDRTLAEARALWWLVDRSNLYIKIPATREGLVAVTGALGLGISVNVTLIFSLQRYDAVMDADLAGLEQAQANGHDLTRLASVHDHGTVRGDTIHGTYDQARQVLEDKAAGVDYDDVVQALEGEGLDKFEHAWNELIESLTDQLEKAGADIAPSGAATPAGQGPAAASRQASGRSPGGSGSPRPTPSNEEE